MVADQSLVVAEASSLTPREQNSTLQSQPCPPCYNWQLRF